jgi:undecaprenyl-diphosphatase
MRSGDAGRRAHEAAVSPLIAALLGIVEGITEYLPISSTGHLILVAQLLGQHGEGAKSFEIVIQLGAIVAVVVHYRTLLAARVAGLVRGRREAIDLAVALAIGFLPVAVVGLVARKAIKRLLFAPVPIAAALFVGGVLMIAVERIRARKARREGTSIATLGLSGIEHVTPRRALVIGLGQCLSLWPGASRSMCTIVSGQLAGLSTATAAEFSFLLAIPTLGAATLYELYKGRAELLAAAGASELVIGLVVSFFVAWAVIAGFLRYLGRRGLEPFGYYRIAVALVVLWVMR